MVQTLQTYVFDIWLSECDVFRWSFEMVGKTREDASVQRPCTPARPTPRSYPWSTSNHFYDNQKCLVAMLHSVELRFVISSFHHQLSFP